MVWTFCTFPSCVNSTVIHRRPIHIAHSVITMPGREVFIAMVLVALCEIAFWGIYVTGLGRLCLGSKMTGFL